MPLHTGATSTSSKYSLVLTFLSRGFAVGNRGALLAANRFIERQLVSSVLPACASAAVAWAYDWRWHQQFPRWDGAARRSNRCRCPVWTGSGGRPSHEMNSAASWCVSMWSGCAFDPPSSFGPHDFGWGQPVPTENSAAHSIRERRVEDPSRLRSPQLYEAAGRWWNVDDRFTWPPPSVVGANHRWHHTNEASTWPKHQGQVVDRQRRAASARLTCHRRTDLAKRIFNRRANCNEDQTGTAATIHNLGSCGRARDFR